jgi:hypothetical protein
MRGASHDEAGHTLRNVHYDLYQPGGVSSTVIRTSLPMHTIGCEHASN